MTEESKKVITKAPLDFTAGEIVTELERYQYDYERLADVLNVKDIQSTELVSTVIEVLEAKSTIITVFNQHTDNISDILGIEEKPKNTMELLEFIHNEIKKIKSATDTIRSTEIGKFTHGMERLVEIFKIDPETPKAELVDTVTKTAELKMKLLSQTINDGKLAISKAKQLRSGIEQLGKLIPEDADNSLDILKAVAVHLAKMSTPDQKPTINRQLLDEIFNLAKLMDAQGEPIEIIKLAEEQIKSAQSVKELFDTLKIDPDEIVTDYLFDLEGDSIDEDTIKHHISFISLAIEKNMIVINRPKEELLNIASFIGRCKIKLAATRVGLVAELREGLQLKSDLQEFNVETSGINSGTLIEALGDVEDNVTLESVFGNNNFTDHGNNEVDLTSLGGDGLEFISNQLTIDNNDLGVTSNQPIISNDDLNT